MERAVCGNSFFRTLVHRVVFPSTKTLRALPPLIGNALSNSNARLLITRFEFFADRAHYAQQPGP